MRDWLRMGGSAAAVAARRGDLWPAGALAEIVTLAWVPLALAVVSIPSLSVLTFAGVEFATAASLPVRIGALASIALGLLLLARLIAAFGEAAVLRAWVRRSETYRPSAVAADAGAIVVVEAVAFLPAMVATAFLLVVAAGEAPRVWQRPDIGGVDAVGRLGTALAPELVLLLAMLILGHVCAAAGRAVLIGGVPTGPLDLVRAAWRVTRAHAAAAIGLGLAGLALRAAFFVAAAVLLRLLWQPLAARVTGGDVWAPATLPLLLGFVFAWLCLVAASGVLHVWLSRWWMAAFGSDLSQVRRVEDAGARWTPRTSSS